jgi:UDP-glucose 4-epimerase
MHIIVTGGAGFIGSHLVDLLIGKNHEVTVIDDLTTGRKENINRNANFENYGISKCPSLKLLIKKSDFIFHLAGRGSVTKSIEDPKKTFAVNFDETFFLLEFLRESPIPLIFASSSSVYGSSKEMPRSISQKIQPISPYAASKASAEMLILGHKHSYNLPLHIARFFNVYGPRQDSKSDYAAVIPKFIRNIIDKENLVIHGDGNQSRDFTYVIDLVKLLSNFMELGMPDETTSNFAFGDSTTINTIADTLLRISGSKVSKSYIKSREGDVPFSQSEKLTRVIDRWPQPRTDLETGLEKTFASFL